MWLSFFNGAGVGAGLIIAIGAQNAFVLGQGLKREHQWWVASICALCDWLLIVVGVLGLGTLIQQSPLLMSAARWGGVAFLLWQASKAIGRMRTGGRLTVSSGLKASLGKVVATTFAITLLNPQVYLDTLVMLGAIGAQQPSPSGFIIGASLASMAWFFGLVAGAGWLAPRLTSRRAWQVIEAFIATILLWVAWQLGSGAWLHG
ncbi:LysE/ArgO family amino acid transporter [Cobetia sp. L2A1]|jgi:L-lysine exporter family protein LysE/ArgO|uniref:LysE/ArgO family amino acid transporter n=1 Tax=Cobetia sp. L2A1 TaxID=2686360 RepID=UPI00131DC326|nr:LysE/ArgO family amino acid transporter [Cobetia sp. L2A1]